MTSDEINREVIPKYFRGEKEDIDLVCSLGEKWGYGNLISHLQRAWSAKLQAQGIDAYGSDMAAGTICAWCHVDKRTGKKVRDRAALKAKEGG